MKYFVQMVFVFTLWIVVSATAKRFLLRKENAEDLQIGKEEDIEYERELEIFEKFENNFVRGNQGNSRQQVLERSGKLL